MVYIFPMPNTLYYGDNLDILREHVPDESVDLVYLDPPQLHAHHAGPYHPRQQ